MALEEKDIDFLKITLNIFENFHRDYQKNTEWFIENTINYYNQRYVLEDSESIIGRIIAFIKKCKTLAIANQNFTVQTVLDEVSARNNLKLRVEIIYETLLAEPEFINPENKSYFDFIIKRRYRTLVRMKHYVNPNSRGFFRYPGECKSDLQVNNDAAIFWESYNGLEDNFFRLKDTYPDPATSIEALFKKKDPCTGNLLDCSRVISILLMDELMEAIDNTTVLDYLVFKDATPNTEHPRKYLVIGNPSDVGAKHFITDTSEEVLFLQSYVYTTDLQPGDHIYIPNHPLYRVFYNGAVRGEHALICSTNKNDKAYSSFTTAGHGMEEDNINGFYNYFITFIQTGIEWTWKVVKIHLDFLNVSPSLPDGVYQIAGGNVKIAKNANGSGLTYFEYQIKFNYKDYVTGKNEVAEGFVIIYDKDEPDKFNISKALTFQNVKPKTFIKIHRDAQTSPPKQEPLLYSISYNKPGQQNDSLYYLFKLNNGVITLNMIDFKTFLGDISYQFKNGRMYTTQPKVSLSPEYISFLKRIHAIN